MEQKGSTGRDDYFDTLKFILITFVVFGHVLDCYHYDRVLLAIDNTIYTFHMPLFVFISGYFCKSDTDRRKKARNPLRLAEPLIVFQILQYMQPLISGEISIISALINPAWSMWYLYSLITWRILAYVAPRSITNSFGATMSIAIASSLLGGFIPISGELSVQRTFTFVPFFFLGYSCRVHQVNLAKYRIPKALAASIIIAAFISMFIINHNMSFVLWGKSPYYPVIWTPFVLRAVYLVSALVMGISVMSIVRPLPDPFLGIGRQTLFVYLYHTFVISAVLSAFTYLNVSLSPITILIAFVLILAILYTLLKIQILHLVINPFSYLVSKHIAKNK